MAALMILRLPVLAFGAAVARLRRLPGAAPVARFASVGIALLLILAFLAFVVWGLERAPQRVALTDLASGALSPMQSWIIISGHMEAQESRIAAFGYSLTDPAAPNASMTVYSEVELPLGPATVSGTFLGPREQVPPGHRWIGQMRADEIQVGDQPPPWPAILLGLTALTAYAARRVRYPMFVGRVPRRAASRSMDVPVGVWRGALSGGLPVRGRLRVEPDTTVTLRTDDGQTQQLRLHSVHTGAEVGRLHYVSSALPALRVRQSTDELTITFDDTTQRDGAAAALIADASGDARAVPPEST